MTQVKPVRVFTMSFLITFLVVMVLGIFLVSASAFARSSGANAPTTVTAEIIKTSSGYTFNKSHLTVTQGERAILHNTTSIEQVITYNGSVIYSIGPRASASGSVHFVAGTYVVHLQSNPKASLTIVVK